MEKDLLNTWEANGDYSEPFKLRFINTTGGDIVNPVLFSLRSLGNVAAGITVAYLSGGTHTTLQNLFAQWNNGMVANIRMLSIRCGNTSQVYQSYGYSYNSSGAEYYENAFFPEQSENQRQAGVKNLIVPKFIVTSNLQMMVSVMEANTNAANPLYISFYPDMLSSKVGKLSGNPAFYYKEPKIQTSIPYILK